MSARRLELVVDEVVLRGIPREQAEATVAALQVQLGVLGERWARSGAPISPRAEAFRRLPPVEASADSPAALGRAVAGAVWAGVSGGGRA